MPITVVVTPEAQKDMVDLDSSMQPDAAGKIAKLGKNYPAVSGMKALTGIWKGHTRVPFRKDWWIIFKIEGGNLVVVKVGHRGDKSLYGSERDMPSRRLGPVSTARDGFAVVPRSFIRSAVGPEPRNFALEYILWSLGQNLREARRAGGLSQKTLASRIGKAQSTVSMAEKGQIRVSSTYVRSVLKACGVPRDWGMRYWRRR